MRRHQVALLVLAGLAILALFLMFIPEREQILLALEDLGLWLLGAGSLFLKIVRVTILLVAIFALTGVLGGIFGGIVLILDEIWVPMREAGWLVHVILALIFGISLGGIVQVKLVPWIVMAPWAPWVNWVFSLFSGGQIFYETTSIPWLVYGMVAFWLGYSTGGFWRALLEDIWYSAGDRLRRLWFSIKDKLNHSSGDYYR